MDNVQNTAPIIPAGTEPTVYGTTTFAGTPSDKGQAVSMPNAGKSEERAPQQVTQTAPQGTTVFEELAAKKGFQNADDLAKAYQELESQNKRVEMSLAELVKLREEPIQPVISTSEVQTPEEAVKVVESIVAKRMRPLEDKLALQDLFYKNPDAAQFASQMGEVVKANPGVSWETAYKAAKFDALDQKSREAGRQEAYQAIQQKQMATISPSTKAKGDERSLVDIVNDRNVPFHEVQRIMHERFRV